LRKAAISTDCISFFCTLPDEHQFVIEDERFQCARIVIQTFLFNGFELDGNSSNFV
jgi:hypothetical protein